MTIKLTILQRAIKEAKASTIVRAKVGAVLFTSTGYIIVSAHNTILYGIKKKWTIHAEEFVLAKALRLKALKRFGKLHLLVVRYKPATDVLANAKPCEKCQELLRKAQIKVFHTDSSGNIMEMKCE